MTLTQSQRDALAMAQSEIAAIITDLTERMKAKGYAKTCVHVALTDEGCEIYLQTADAKTFRVTYDPKARDFAFCRADSIAEAIEKSYAAIDGMDDISALDNWFTEQPILAGEAS